MYPLHTDGEEQKTCRLENRTHLHSTELASVSVFLKRKDISTSECQRSREVVDKWNRERNFSLLFLLPSRRTFLEVSIWF